MNTTQGKTTKGHTASQKLQAQLQERIRKSFNSKTQRLDIQIALSDDGKAWISSKAMNFSAPSGNITKDVAILTTEWLSLMECEFGLQESKAQSEDTKIAFHYYQQPLEAWEANYPVN